MKARYAPLDARTPALRAAERPRLDWLTTRIRSRYSASTDAVSSVEPSSTTTISKSVNDCAKTLPSALTIVAAPLKTGRITDTLAIRGRSARATRAGLGSRSASFGARSLPHRKVAADHRLERVDFRTHQLVKARFGGLVERGELRAPAE